DLDKNSYATFEDLEPYLRGVACSVGELAVRIFGCRNTSEENLKDYVRLFGCAFQMTNIMRDVGADLELGRVYLPEADMKEAGYSRQELIRREPTPAFARLMEMEYNRAAGFYRRARNCVDFRDRPALLPAEIMARIYEKILEEMRQDGFRVLFKRYRVSRLGKIACVLDSWLYCHGIHL
ncbi:MAG: phytoene/squalene synthase family protein, partial [bacterium]